MVNKFVFSNLQTTEEIKDLISKAKDANRRWNATSRDALEHRTAQNEQIARVADQNAAGYVSSLVDAVEQLLNELANQSPAIEKIVAERARQDAKWGQQNHDAGKWSFILVEELGEVAKSQLEGDRANHLTELVQAAAVLVAWIECELRK